ncbi:MAG: SDR family oxidoreductase, partial [Planctomycetota bacterium]
MSGLFHEKKGLVTGVFNKQSLAWAIADRVLAEGATCGFTHMPDRPDDERRKNESRVRKLIDGRDRVAFLQPMDVTADDQIDAVAATCADQLGKLDFLVHSVAFAPPEDLKKDTVDCSREGFKLAMAISVHSLMALVSATKDLMNPGASVLTLTYYGGEKTVPGYNVMGVCKAALDATVRYLAYEMGPRGVRVNALSPG